MTVLTYIYLKYSKHGYEIAVVGESQRTASYAGIKVERVIIGSEFFINYKVSLRKAGKKEA